MIIPAIGDSGSFTFSPPYDTYSAQNQLYTCQGMRTLTDYLANNEDPYNNIYVKYGLTEQDYTQDKTANMQIVTLQNSVGGWLYIPARFILSYPKNDGIVYHGKALVIDLGMMTIDKDTTTLQSQVSDLVFDSIGIRPEVYEAENRMSVLVPTDEHEALETARQNNVTVSLSYRGQVEMWKDRYLTTLTKVQELEAFIQGLL